MTITNRDKTGNQEDFPTERDVLIALLDAVMSLSNRMFPDEQMVVNIISVADHRKTNVQVVGDSQTTWIKKETSQGI